MSFTVAEQRIVLFFYVIRRAVRQPLGESLNPHKICGLLSAQSPNFRRVIERHAKGALNFSHGETNALTIDASESPRSLHTEAEAAGIFRRHPHGGLGLQRNSLASRRSQ